MKIMKIRYAAMLVAAIAGLATVTSASAGVLADIKARGKLICGTQGTSPRYSFENPITRTLEGYELELCKGLAESLNVQVEYKIVSSQNRITELLQGRVDTLAALISYSPERAQQFDFSKTYFWEPFIVGVRKDSGISNLDGLKKARIGSVKGSLLEPIITGRFPEASLVSYDDPDQEFLAFQQGKVVAMSGRRGNIREYQIKAGEDKMVILSEPLLASAVGFPVQKGNADFVEAIDKFLAAYEASGKGAELYAKWFGDMKMDRGFKLADPIK